MSTPSTKLPTIGRTIGQLKPLIDPSVFKSTVNIGSIVEGHLRAERHDTERKHGFANVIYPSIAERIAKFQETLDPDHEVGAALASFGASRVIRIANVSFEDPFLIIFEGESEDGEVAELIQHVSQLNILLVALKKPSDRPARRMGFVTQDI